ncbi:GerW family sporulation protein [Roseicyclus persicicus]|uniref:Sporulation protein YtfJ n=1 Tax=Roseicyclus persicicus TaxID=2650661 RepID=A0A7X6JYP3_9RHOB|nr:spore germination protein GerW family protein [Roseibacterium persicicum]NKX44699.1 sporulation protein YtfJ [Roseibacterium persicicum]
MTDVNDLLEKTVAELDRLLNARNVLGDPIERDGMVVVPIVSYGFGFGAGSGTGDGKGTGGGAGAGGGIKPLGAIILDAHGARVEGMKGTVSSLVQTLADAAGRVMAARDGKAPETEG